MFTATISPPVKHGWYWLRRLSAVLPEVGYWTGQYFLTITPSQPMLYPKDVERCCDGPLEPPEEYAN